ncbi:putative SAGA-associated factor [Clavispora lusitaniae]|uniref:SAGA-associated factor n=1 Tax=Clavispora lusitaniae TaxID=36911 RepID=A0AA91T103_CLALS|nr:putative SAGA-associated factor [Clavispora lusitaniae]
MIAHWVSSTREKTAPVARSSRAKFNIGETFKVKGSKYLKKAMSSFKKSDGAIGDSRKRQSKKDEAIRRKIEYELSKKRGQSSRTSRKNKAVPGTVSYLKPSEAIICKKNATVYQAAQLMSARRENCILVVNDDGELIGIFTAKDLAFRVVGSGLNANATLIEQIMTPSPICANADSPASEALTLMVEKGFRHLPVLDDKSRIVGVLDITKSYAQQMEKLERLHASSKNLYEALDSVHNEMGVADQPRHIFEYFEDLKSKMDGPTLSSVLDSATTPIYTNVKCSVLEATIQMKENRTTAVLVNDTSGELTGIFTSKDVVLRVIAAGLNPKTCSVVRVMTPQPDVANERTSIQQALRQMFEGHYLNLPVVDNEGDIIGIVDVLKLTYATLNQIKRIEQSSRTSDSVEESSEGPAWNKFWTSLDNDSDYANSDSLASAPDVTPSEMQSFNIEIGPSDSVSAVEASSLLKQSSKSMSNISLTESFTFKFKSPAMHGRVHRVSLKQTDTLSDLRSVINEKLHSKDLEAIDATLEGHEAYAISYVDDEGDIVSITSDNDLKDCIRINQQLQSTKADLFIHNPNLPAISEHISKQRKSKTDEEVISGVSNTVLLSAAIGAATLLATVFVVSRRK